MDIRFLESFVTVAECGSIAEAARRLNLTPAALAQRLRALEQDLGHSLVSRVGRTVRPTASGLAVLRHAGALIEGARDLRAIAANDQPEGQLRLGATATALTGLLPAIVILLREILVSGLREYLASLRVGMPVTRLAKWKTGFQMGALGVLLAGDTGARALGLGFLPLSLLGELGLWAAAVLTMITGWDYMISGLRHAGAQDAQAAATLRGRS